jgi:hypothetical protein
VNFRKDQQAIAEKVAASENKRMSGGFGHKIGTDDVYEIARVYLLENVKALDETEDWDIYDGPTELIDFTVSVILLDNNSSFSVDLEVFQKEYSFSPKETPN